MTALFELGEGLVKQLPFRNGRANTPQQVVFLVFAEPLKYFQPILGVELRQFGDNSKFRPGANGWQRGNRNAFSVTSAGWRGQSGMSYRTDLLARRAEVHLAGVILGLALALGAPPQAAASEETVEDDTPVPSLTVQVQSADGKPLPQAILVCIGRAKNAILSGTTIEGGYQRFQTDAEGRFSLPGDGKNLAVAVANSNGFCLMQTRDLAKHPAMRMQPWGHIEGVAMNCGQPLANRGMSYSLNSRYWVSRDLERDIDEAIEIQDSKVVADAAGRFVFEHVPPGQVTLCERHGPSYDIVAGIDVKPGETSRITIATEGRPVVGRLELPAGLTNQFSWADGDGWLSPDVDLRQVAQVPSVPPNFDTFESRAKWRRNWAGSDAGRRRLELLSRKRQVEFHADGSFAVDLAIPGTYRISGDWPADGRPLALLKKVVEIPAAETNAGNAPFDLGKLTVQAAGNLKIGEVAPDFCIKTLDGKPLNFSDFRGKFVLLDFWATWCGPCINETPHMKAAYDAFGNDKRFAIISLSLDSEPTAPMKFARKEGVSWSQGFLGDWSKDKVTASYGVFGIPAIFLIGPNGKVLATDLRGAKIKEAVADALAP